MRHFLKLLFLASSAIAFSPTPNRIFQPSLKTSAPIKTNIHMSLANQDLKPKMNKEEASTPTNSTVVGNLVATANHFVQKFLEAGGGDDPIGTRGEAYFFLQAILIVAIVLGGIPVIGDYLQLLAGPGLLAAGVVVLAITALNMGDSITPWPKPNGQGLVQDGLYGQMRHPMYFGLLSTMTGFSIMTGSIQRILLTLVLYVAIDIKSDYEEEELKKAYPDYEEYRLNVRSKFVPKVWLDVWKNKEQELDK